MTPKQLFLQRADDVKFHANIANSTPFINAMHSALLNYQYRLVYGVLNGQEEAAANFHKLAGAKEFIDEFLGLSATPTPAKRVDRGNLQQIP